MNEYEEFNINPDECEHCKEEQNQNTDELLKMIKEKLEEK